MDLLDRMLDHDQWATTQLLEVSRDLTDAQLDQPFDVGHGTLRLTFEHIVENIEFWNGLMTGQPPDPWGPAPSIAALRERSERAYAAFAASARRFRDEQRLDDTFIDHYNVRKSMGGTIIVVVQHNVEHRTEALHILQRLGVPDLPEVDYGVVDYLQLNT
jgi:uncharacterized damage-inducible protein DinB